MWQKKENNSESQTSVNDKYKDRLFVFIFGREENKASRGGGRYA